MTIKLIAVDLDGTLLNSQHQMTERTEKALKSAIEQGVKVILATGKTRHSGEHLIQRLNLTTPGIYLQGLAVYYADGSVRHQQTLDANIARRVITYAEDRGFEVVAYSGGRMLVRTTNPASNQLHAQYHEPAPEAVGPLQNHLGTVQINKLLLIKSGDARKIAALRWQLSKQFTPKELKLTQALSDMLEILPPGASKGTVLKTLLKELDIKAEEVLAIGDGENDIEMIQLAGIGVAMGNGNEKLKAVADYVVASNDEDGVAEAVERFALIQPKLITTPDSAAPDSPSTPAMSTPAAEPVLAEAAAEVTTAVATEILATAPTISTNTNTPVEMKSE